MAYVPTNESVISSIRSKIKELHSAELQNLIKTSNPIKSETSDPRMVDIVQRKHWGEHLPLRDTVPAAWLQTKDEAVINFSGFPGNYHVTVKTKQPMKFQPRTEVYHAPKIRAHADDIGDAELVKQISEFCVLRKAVSDRWEAVVNQVVTYLRTCKSLNEAVKHYPDIRLFCPPDIISRLDKKVEKAERSTAAASQVATMDTSLISASAVAASLASS